MSNACARLSSAQGPAIKASGKPLPNLALPTSTMALGVAGMSSSAATMKRGPHRVNHGAGRAASRNSFPFSRCALASEFCPRHGKKALPTHLPIKRREAERRKARSPGRISGCGARHVNECCHSSTLRARSPFGAPPRHLPRRTHPDIGSALSPALPETRRIRALPSATCLSLPRSAETGRCAGRAVTRGRPGAVCETARGNRTCSTF